MQFSIQNGSVFATLEIDLNEAERVVAQPDSMLSMTSGIHLTATVGRRGDGKSWWSGAKGLMGGESFFTAEFTAKRDGQHLSLAPASNGDILQLDLDGTKAFFLSRGSFLANVGYIDMKVKYEGMKGFMSKTGLFLLNVSGTGTVFCQSYGAIVMKELQADEKFFLDNRYALAFSESVTYQLVKATKSIKDSLMSGEGLINKYTGPGRLYYQTRAKPTTSWLSYFLSPPI